MFCNRKNTNLGFLGNGWNFECCYHRRKKFRKCVHGLTTGDGPNLPNNQLNKAGHCSEILEFFAGTFYLGYSEFLR